MANLALTGGSPVFPKEHRWPAWPFASAQDETRVLEVLRSGAWGIGSPATAQFATALAQSLGVRHALPVNSGTAALELVIKALGIGPGDEVIVPAYTFVASATSALVAGATVLFADIDSETLNIAPAQVARLISPRTKAVIAVHFGGNPCDIEGLGRVLAGKNIALIEDAAHAHGMLYRGQPAGKLGRAACFSYQSSKNMAAGEAGALVTDDTKLFEMAESFHSFGRQPGRPWYEHHYISTNNRVTGMQSALLLGQLERLEQQTQIRGENGHFLNTQLARLPGQKPQRCPDQSPQTRRAFHIYIWRYDAQIVGVSREVFLQALNAEGVPASGGYPTPLQENPMFTERRFWHQQFCGNPHAAGEPDYRLMATPVTKAVCSDAIWLPQSYLLASRQEVEGIVVAVSKILTHRQELAQVAVPVAGAAR